MKPESGIERSEIACRRQPVGASRRARATRAGNLAENRLGGIMVPRRGKKRLATVCNAFGQGVCAALANAKEVA